MRTKSVFDISGKAAIAAEGASKPLQGSGLTDAQAKAMMEAMTGKIPLKRMGAPDDIAKVAQFLASEACGDRTGGMLPA